MLSAARRPRPSPSPSPSPYPSTGDITSTLWGTDGSDASPRLLDFSYAGYRQGQPIPENIPSLKRAAIAATNCAAGAPCALFFPAGRYLLSSNFTNTKNLVLLGAGMDSTTLFFSKSLQDLYGNKKNSAGQSQSSFGPGMLNFVGEDPMTYSGSGATLRSYITANAERGSNTVSVNLQVDQWVRITASDQLKGNAKGKLVAYLYGDKLKSSWSDLVGKDHMIQFLAKVTGITPNTAITLDQELPYDLRTEWRALSVHDWSPAAASQEMGMADLSIEFPNSGPYPGHFKEKGYNALFINMVANSFARNVRVLNADYSLLLQRSYFCTMSNIVIDTTYNRGADAGHHGISIARGRDILITDCVFKAPQVHDVTFDWYTTAAVVRRASATDVNFDFHRAASYGNLVTDCHLGASKRPFKSGGSKSRGPYAGSWQTF
uniref:Uncharacterized protein n=1 Tax=Tetradesmus obliquus TaxID=3088 RepID=A0A383WBX2_TETOB|eukprot:jgi/Sobl393_1/10674/SZX74710.1